MILRAPFPWFGGKSSIADVIWSRLGNVPNYVEPFFGSGAVLLARPDLAKVQTINDKDKFVANFWRAVKYDPDGVASHADAPINETELHSWHWWLITKGAKRLEALESDPELYDAEVAGRWMWGTCQWIGSGFCSGDGPWQINDAGWENKHLSNAGQGINRKRPHLNNGGRGINRQLPHLGDAGQGINRKLPHLGDAGRGAFIRNWMQDLAERLRDVRVCAGGWERVCGPSVTHRHGLTGVFLDPPYADTAGRAENLYATDSMTVAHDVRKWAIEEGKNPLMRICLAGYEGEHNMPSDWEIVAWKTQGGFGLQGDDDGSGRANSERERLWFSPACIKIHRDKTLFDLMEAAE